MEQNAKIRILFVLGSDIRNGGGAERTNLLMMDLYG